jgi:GT2 family glycosyltransferase
MSAPVARSVARSLAGPAGAAPPAIRHIAGAATPPSGRYDADIVILALDRAAETLAAIASAIAQRGVSRHVFILDQGSRTDTLALLAEAVAGRSDATLVSAGSNLGVAAGRNAVSALGHGRIIVALDNDATFGADDTVAGMAAALADDPSLAAIGCRILVDADGTDDLTSWGYPRSLLARAEESWDAATFVGAGHAIRRAAWDDAGGYDPALFFCWEEFDFCLRAIANGWRIRYRGDLTIRHKVSPEQRVGWSDRRWFYFVRNRLYIGRKSGSGWFGLLPHLAAYSLRGLRHRRFGQTVRAFAAARALAPLGPGLSLAPAARAYLQRADRMHRHTWLRQAIDELRGSSHLADRRGARDTGFGRRTDFWRFRRSHADAGEPLTPGSQAVSTRPAAIV